MKRIFFCSGIKPFKGMKIVLKPEITGLIIIVFASVLFVGCSNDNSGGKEKSDPATQSNEQRDDDKGDKNTKYEGMNHNAPGKDTIHREKQQ